MADRRNLAHWVRCDGPQGCGHEWREDRHHRRRGPRVFKWCPRCGLRQPFTGYMAESPAPQALQGPAGAATAASIPGNDTTGTMPAAAPPAPADQDVRPQPRTVSTPELAALALRRLAGGRRA